MTPKTLKPLLAAAMLLSTCVAQANVAFTYQGQPYSEGVPSAEIGYFMTGQAVFTDAITNNFTGTASTVLGDPFFVSYELTSGDLSSGSDAGHSSWAFINGQITAWFVVATDVATNALLITGGGTIFDPDNYDQVYVNNTVTGTEREVVGEWTRVISVSPIPEPETYAMILTGFGIIGFRARNRKRAQDFQ
jgi:hypothetical protein